MTEAATKTYVTLDCEWNDILDAYETAYAVVDLGKPWNGFATPVVTRAVAEAIVRRSQMLSAGEEGMPYVVWDGAGVLSYDADGNEDACIGSKGAGLYDLSELGWTFEVVTEDTNVIRRIG